MADLYCAICLYDGNPAPANPAETIIAGVAVCYDHLSFVSMPHEVVMAAKREPIDRAIEEADRG